MPYPRKAGEAFSGPIAVLTCVHMHAFHTRATLLYICLHCISSHEATHIHVVQTKQQRGPKIREPRRMLV